MYPSDPPRVSIFTSTHPSIHPSILTTYLSAYPSVYLSIYLSVYLYIHIYICMYISIYTYLHLSICLPIELCTGLPVYQAVYLSLATHVYVRLHSYTCLVKDHPDCSVTDSGLGSGSWSGSENTLLVVSGLLHHAVDAEGQRAILLVVQARSLERGVQFQSLRPLRSSQLPGFFLSSSVLSRSGGRHKPLRCGCSWLGSSWLGCSWLPLVGSYSLSPLRSGSDMPKTSSRWSRRGI